MGCTQISVNTILAIPEHKPDIASILRVATRATIDKTITMRKRIFFAGHIDICIEYVACTCDNSNPIHLLHTKIPFNGLTFHRRARECFHAFLKTKIRFYKNDIIAPRKINTIVVLQLCKPRLHRVVKAYVPQYCHPYHGSICKSISPYCGPIQKPFYQNSPSYSCAPPPPILNCKQYDSCDSSIPADDHACKPYQDNECKPISHECKPLAPDCKPPSHIPDCNKQPCKQSTCKPPHSYECKPPVHSPECIPQHYSGYCKPPTYDDYACKPAHKKDYKPYEYVFSDDFYAPTYIQPYQKMGSRHGVTFGFNYEE